MNSLGRWLKGIYQKLPVIRELRTLQLYAAGIERRLYGMEGASKMEFLETLKRSDPRYIDPKRLMVHGAQYSSQNFEDGMIEEIFRRVPPVKRTFVEIGVENGSVNNTLALLVAGWSGWWLEGSAEDCASIQQRLEQMPELKQRLSIKNAFVSPTNINQLFAELKIPEEVDLFSLDIDLDTYHIWAALRDFHPRVVVVEYNSGISPEQSWISPWMEGTVSDSSRPHGASLKAFEKLGYDYGYSLVGCDVMGVNAFFIRNDLVGDYFSAPFTSENHYESPRLSLVFRHGSPSLFYGESHDPEKYPYGSSRRG